MQFKKNLPFPSMRQLEKTCANINLPSSFRQKWQERMVYFSGRSMFLKTKNHRPKLYTFTAKHYLKLYFLYPLILLACGPDQENPPNNTYLQHQTKDFKTKECYKEYFPLAIGIPNSSIPPEVQFYCAAPWNIAAFESVSAEIKNVDFDIVSATVRTVPVHKKKFLEKSLTLAIQAADKGPPGMGAVWRVYYFLPLLNALRDNSPAALEVHKIFQKDDVKKLKVAANKINWNQPAFNQIQHQSTPAIEGDAHLKDIAAFILKDK